MIGEWILVTGGSGGIGAATCTRLAEAGFRPAIGYCHDRQMAERIAASCNGVAVALNLMDRASVDAAIDWLKTVPLRGAVLNASCSPTIARFVDLGCEEMKRQWQVAVLGHYRLLAGLIINNFRLRRSGTVVGVLTSALGDAATGFTPQMASYLVAKAGLAAILNAAQAEYPWLKVATVSPGFTETPMLNAFDPRFIEMMRVRGSVSSPDVIAAKIEALFIS